MPSDRTERVEILLDRAMARRLKAACAKLRVTPSDIFELGFNATFPLPPLPPKPRPTLARE